MLQGGGAIGELVRGGRTRFKAEAWHEDERRIIRVVIKSLYKNNTHQEYGTRFTKTISGGNLMIVKLHGGNVMIAELHEGHVCSNDETLVHDNGEPTAQPFAHLHRQGSGVGPSFQCMSTSQWGMNLRPDGHRTGPWSRMSEHRLPAAAGTGIQRQQRGGQSWRSQVPRLSHRGTNLYHTMRGRRCNT